MTFNFIISSGCRYIFSFDPMHFARRNIFIRVQLAILFILICMIVVGLFGLEAVAQTKGNAGTRRNAVKVEKLSFIDKDRNNRVVPVVLYSPVDATSKSLKFAIINHGYGMKNTEYSFIANNLVSHGYLVASIQHDLATDLPMPSVGKPSEVRLPFWERGVENIRFVLRELRRMSLQVDFESLLIIGHSNGGDISALFAEEHPKSVGKLITLDNRRMRLPRRRKPQTLSMRSADQKPDQGVLPSVDEQKKFGMKIVVLENTNHDDMWDGATEIQKREINNIVSNFLESH